MSYRNYNIYKKCSNWRMKGCKVWQKHILSMFVIQYMDNCAIFRELPLNFIEGELCLIFANFAEKNPSWIKQEILVQFRNNTNFSSSNECEYCFVCKKIKKVSGSGEKHSPLKVKWSVPYGKHVMIRIRNMNHLAYLCQECLWFNEWQPWNENTL